LVSLKNYLDVGGLYNHVYTQYGPFYYESVGLVYRVLGKPVTFDSGRDLTLAMWVTTAFLCGASIARLTRSTLLGIAGTLIVSKLLLTYPGEPLHPGHLLVLLLAATVAIAVFMLRSRPWIAIAAMGVIAGAALLVKINVGLFACLAVVFAAAFTLVRGPNARWVRGLTIVLAVAVPFALMAKKLGKGWGDSFALPFAVHVGLAILALGLASTTVSAGAVGRLRDIRALIGFFAGAIALIVVSAVGVLVDGTSLRGLVDGVIVHPLHQADVLIGLIVVPAWVVMLDVLMVAAAGLLAWWRTDMRGAHGPAVAIGRIVGGATIWYVLAGIAPQAGARVLWLPLTLAWIAAVPSARDDGSVGSTYLRVFIPALAVFESLHAYPVSGSQIAWSSFLLVIAGAVCISDGIADLGAWVHRSAPEWRQLHEGGGRALIGVVAINASFIALLLPLQDYSRAYNHGVPLGLPGTARIRLPVGTADAYRAVSEELRKRCSTFVSLPGLDSFYLLANEPPPTLLNAGDWMYLFDTAQQQHVVSDVRDVPRLCAIRHDGILAFWEQGRPLPQEPLARFIENRFKPVFSVAGFEVMTMKRQRG
jgi:hypothetical protein